MKRSITILAQCTPNSSLSKIYDNCDTKAATHSFGDGYGQKEAIIFSNYLRGTVGEPAQDNKNCPRRNASTSLALRSKVCIYFSSDEIYVDVNGDEGPNELNDQFRLTINTDSKNSGIKQDIDYILTKSAICSSFSAANNNMCVLCSALFANCQSCTQSGCTECGDGYGLNSSGECISCPSRCKSCTESGCTECFSSYGLNSSGQCIDCFEFDWKCTLCDKNGCIRCLSGSILNSSGQCVNCSSLYSGCDSCTESGCTECKSGYILNSSGQCVSEQ